MPFQVKDWKNAPDASTALSAENFEDLEARLGAYADQLVALRGRPAVRLTRAAAQPIPNNAATPIVWTGTGHEREDADGMHASGSSDVVIPAGMGGLYLATLSGLFAANATGARAFYIYQNGSIRAASTMAAVGGGIGTGDAIPRVLRCAAGDVLDARVWQNSGGALDVVKAADFSPEFQVVRIGP